MTNPKPLYEIVTKTASIIQELEIDGYQPDDMLQIATQLMVIVEAKAKSALKSKLQAEAMDRLVERYGKQ